MELGERFPLRQNANEPEGGIKKPAALNVAQI